MTGPEHYRRAEELLDEVRGPETVRNHDDRARSQLLAEAQVHATLAAVAARVHITDDSKENAR